MTKRRPPQRKTLQRRTVRRESGVALPILGQAPAREERADAARNRVRILNAARKLLGRRSIQEICMDELAQVAGVGKGTLYRRFENRSSLCLALLDDSERQLQRKALRWFDLPVGTSALARTRALISALFDFVLENAQLLSEAEACERGGPKRYQHPVHVWRRLELTRALTALQHEQGVPDTNVAVLAEFVLVALDPDLLMFQLKCGVSPGVLRNSYLQFCLRGSGATA